MYLGFMMNDATKGVIVNVLAATGNLSGALKQAGVSRRQFETMRDSDADFEEQVENAWEIAADALETEARRRAVEGVTKDIYYKGEIVGQEQVYSDSLLMFLLKGRRRETFGDATKITGDKAAPLTIEVVDVLGNHQATDMTKEDVRELVGKAVQHTAAVAPAVNITINNNGDDLA